MVGGTRSPYRLRPCEATDAAEIVSLFQRSFKAPYALEIWRWKYQQSPWARPELSMLAELASGEIVAHVGAMLHPLNLIGQPLLVAQSTDVMIDERHRHRGVSRALYEGCLEGIAAAGIPACLGFPNRDSLRAVHRASHHVAILEKYHLPLGSPHHGRLRERVNAVPEGSRFRFEFNPRYELDARYAAVWRSCSELESLSLWKDREYITWRYRAAPAQPRVCTLEFGGEIVALGVCREQGKHARVLDLIARDKNVHASRELLLCLADEYLGRGFEELSFVGSDPWFFAEVFAEFERRPAFWGHFFVRASSRAEASLYENSLNWTVASGDADA